MGETDVCVADVEQSALCHLLGSVEEIAALLCGEHFERDALACAHGCGDYVVIVGVGIYCLAVLYGALACADDAYILFDVGNVP